MRRKTFNAFLTPNLLQIGLGVAVLHVLAILWLLGRSL